MGARGTGRLAPLAFIFALAVSLPWARTAGAQQSCDRVLPGCGICYPGGFDVNTVGRVQVTLVDLEVPDEGPVRLTVAGEGERWVVLASPGWFWRMADVRPAPGDILTVQGSKTLGADGTLYVVAQEIRFPGHGAAVVLRDRRGIPLWGNGNRGGGMTGAGRGDGDGLGKGRGYNGGGRR
jgi:hypothetical protein